MNRKYDLRQERGIGDLFLPMIRQKAFEAWREAWENKIPHTQLGFWPHHTYSGHLTWYYDAR